MSYSKLSPTADVKTFFKSEKSVVQARLWLPKGMHSATPCLHDDGSLKVQEVPLTDSKNVGKSIFLMNVTVHLVDSEGVKTDIVGDIAIDSETALKDALTAVTEETTVFVSVSHNLEKGACYCTLASNEQVKIKYAADLMAKAAAKKKAELENTSPTA